MRGINPAIPRDAIKGNDFEVGGGGDHPARSVRIDLEDGVIWSATVDNPDRNVLGRTWVTEITVAKRSHVVTFGARLLNVTRQNDDPFVPSIPRLVRDIVNRNTCRSAGVRLFDKPTYVNNETELEWLIALVSNPARKMPVVIVAESNSREPLVNIGQLAARTCGAAHVVGLSNRQQSAFREFTGRDFAVFDGSVRLFWSKFDIDTADIYSQPIWIPSTDRPGTWATTSIIYRVLAASVSKGTTDYPRFQAVRQAAAEIALRNARLSSSDAELARLFEEENAALQIQLQDARDEHNQWLVDAENDKKASESDVAELRSEVFKLKMQNEMLRLSIESSGAEIKKEPLEALGDFREWAARNLSSRIWISPKAFKEVDKNTLYRAPREIGDALIILDDYYAAMKLNAGGERHQVLQQKLDENGFEISPCFSQAGDIRGFPEYSVTYKGTKMWCDLHLKRNGGTDPRTMFRIYFLWDEYNKTLLVGHLPTHLDNNLTN